jgi:hypothetical protein
MYQEPWSPLRNPESLTQATCDLPREAGMRQGSRLDLAPSPGAADAHVADSLAAALERLVSCPECGLPAEILSRFSLGSTEGAVAHIALGCVGGHFFRMAVDRLPAEVLLQTGL